MSYNTLTRKKFNGLCAFLAACLVAAACVGLQAGLSEPVQATNPDPDPLQLEISVRRRMGWSQEWVEYRVMVDKPERLGIMAVTIQYKVIDQQDSCDATASWSQDLERNHRNLILDKWKTKPNYLFFLRNSVLKYLGKKFCFKISKADVGNQSYLDGYAEFEIEKWWDDVRQGGVCPSVYAWIKDDEIMRGGQTTLYWKISNVRHPASVWITARNHDYWFYDTSQAEPNIKKKYGNPHEVTLTHDAGAIAASRTVVGHLPPRTHNLYIVKVRQAGCPVARDAVFMRVVD